MADTSPQNRIRIFDTTLRDGEQAPGCSMTITEKLRVARALAELRVDIIEAGFPAASPGDFEAVRAIARRGLEARRSAGSRAVTRRTSRRLHAAVKSAARPSHPCLRRHERHPSRTQAEDGQGGDHQERRRRGAHGARMLCDDVEFSPEDASRTELSSWPKSSHAAIEAGATTVNIPDTVGYTVPAEFDELFRYLKQNVAGIDAITSACTVTTTSAWRSRTASPPCAPARARSNAPSTASANAPAIAVSRKS